MEAMAQAALNQRTPQPIIETLTYENESVNRYVWYAGEDLPWPELKGGFIKRCRVAPIVSVFIWERIGDVPTDMRKRLRKEWHDKDYAEAEYEIRPQGIFNSVMELYGELGVRELTALKGLEEQAVLALNIDVTFCPWHSDDIPKPYREIEAHIQKVLNTASLSPILRQVGEEMLASIKASRQYDDIFVDQVEGAKEPVYSKPVFRAMSRLERRRRDKALSDLAEADVAMKNAAAQASNDNSALVAEMAEQNRLKREELELRREELELNRQAIAKQKPPKNRATADAK